MQFFSDISQSFSKLRFLTTIANNLIEGAKNASLPFRIIEFIDVTLFLTVKNTNNDIS